MKLAIGRSSIQRSHPHIFFSNYSACCESHKGSRGRLTCHAPSMIRTIEVGTSALRREKCQCLSKWSVRWIPGCVWVFLAAFVGSWNCFHEPFRLGQCNCCSLINAKIVAPARFNPVCILTYRRSGWVLHVPYRE
jgi:hypothetical protein